ncbi:hypothetical protein QQX98_002331 [Neonectria punicea]|uniref:Epoxide hydrolase N-terminal domain-containing protein n=1 Tax=Neonectria punicea TaxID=979145 RepID=A0ABR1HKY0_9HYPO
MWYKNLLALFVSFEVVNAFGSVPHTAKTIPEKFTLRIPDRQIKDFKSLLAASKVGPENLWLTEAKHAWLKFDWRRQEDRINSVPNFKITVNDADVGKTSMHFAALFSAKKDALPLLFLHGWPGSFLEFLPMLDILKRKYTPETLPYHIIVPSLPHYGLSGGPSDVELTLEVAARLLNQLMVDLGFDNGYIA